MSKQSINCERSVSVVIPNYNGVGLLKNYLPYTIKALDRTGLRYEIIVVDDCSTDGSVPFLSQSYPDIKVMENEHNKGFSYTCNRGISASTMDLVFLLNSDVKLTEDYFDKQWRYFEKSDTFGVMGRIMSMDGERIEDAARMLDLNGGKLKANRLFYATQGQDVYTAYLSGANALVDRKKLLSIGGFNEIFSPFYYEDMDLSLRAWRMGWKCYYEHEAVCFHQVSASTKNYKTAKWVKQVYFRNRFMLHAIHLEGVQLYLYFARILLVDLIPMLLVGNLWIWKSYVDFYKNRDKLMQCKDTYVGFLEGNKAMFSINEVIGLLRKPLYERSIVRV